MLLPLDDGPRRSVPSPGWRIALTFWKTYDDDDGGENDVVVEEDVGDEVAASDVGRPPLNLSRSANHRPRMAEAKLGAVLRLVVLFLLLAAAAVDLSSASLFKLKFRITTGPSCASLPVVGCTLYSGRLNSWRACSVMDAASSVGRRIVGIVVVSTAAHLHAVVGRGAIDILIYVNPT